MKYLIITLYLFIVACSDHTVGPPNHNDIGIAAAPMSIAGNSTTNAGPAAPNSGGANPLGVAIPTGPGVVGRLVNGLEGNVSSAKGNFARGLASVAPNLPSTTNVMSASGYDQIELLAYAACTDLTTGGTPIMQSKYNVIPSATVTANQAALVAAGMRMLDQHTAGIASQGTASAALTTIFTNLVQSESTATSQLVFVTVCVAANTAGSTMLGM